MNKYQIYMRYPNKKRWYKIDMRKTKERANKLINSMKRQGYKNMKFKIKKS